jgi:hypothetical protein
MSIPSSKLSTLAADPKAWQPQRGGLFSGHMIDAPDRSPPRFPAIKEGIAAHHIASTLDQLCAGKEDLALTQGALRWGYAVCRNLPATRCQAATFATFLRARIYRKIGSYRRCRLAKTLSGHTRALETLSLAAPQVLGELAPDADPYERCNLWLLASALAYGPEKLTFICLCDGEGGEKPGGTAHMVEEVRKHKGRVIWLNTKTLW